MSPRHNSFVRYPSGSANNMDDFAILFAINTIPTSLQVPVNPLTEKRLNDK